MVVLSHIDRIVSEWQTSMIKLQHHSSIFGDTAVQFPKDELNLIEAIFDKASVHPRNIVLARYDKYFAHAHEVLDTHRTLCSAYCRLCLSVYRTRELFCFACVPARTTLPGKLLKNPQRSILSPQRVLRSEHEKEQHTTRRQNLLAFWMVAIQYPTGAL